MVQQHRVEAVSRIDDMWGALKAECCKLPPDEAQMIVFLSEKKFRAAMEPFLSCIEGRAVEEKSVAFTAYNQGVEDALAAIRGEKVDDPYAAPTFINAIARKCSPHVYVNRLATQGQRSARECLNCGHDAMDNGGFCTELVLGPVPLAGLRYCGCKCVFPAPPEPEQLKAESRKPAGDCANCGSPIVEAFAPGVGDYWYHVRGLVYCDTDNPSSERTATPQRLTKEEVINASTPVPAEAAAQDETPIDLIAWKWANSLSESEQSVLLSSSIKRLQRMIVERCPPSTATNSAAVEATAQVETRLGTLPLSLIDDIDQRRETLYKGFDYHLNPQIAQRMKSDLDYLRAFVAAFRHFPPTEGEKDQ